MSEAELKAAAAELKEILQDAIAILETNGKEKPKQ
jgi:hypothetical protein